MRLNPLCVGVLAVLLASAPAAFAQDAHTDDHDHDHGDEPEALDAVVVESTRSRRLLAEDPIRVEVIQREEIEEKLLMTPGNIAMLVAETGGIRVQATAPALGASNIRIQGLRGRYTQLLADGLPLYGGQASSVGLLQIPPTDLGRVEIVKGSASALYGGSALGGVINLISRRPGDTPRREWLFNATSRDGQDLTLYADAPLGPSWQGSITAGTHHQARQDLDGDGWLDMPEYSRQTVRPRLFWSSPTGARALVTAGITTEDRRGGTLPGRRTPDGTSFPLAQDTTRFDAGAVVDLPVGDVASLQARASVMRADHRHRFGGTLEVDRHESAFAEASYSSSADATTWVAGVALQSDAYRSRAFPAFDYDFTVPGVFAQAEHRVRDDLTLAASARFDHHSAYGGHLSPRLSLLYRPGPWTVRASLGRGFHGPTPFVEEIEAAGLSRLVPLRDLEAERATTASLDVGYAHGGFEGNLTLFASDVDDAVRLARTTDTPDGTPRVELVNAQGTTRTRGSEVMLRYRWSDVVVTGSYVFMDSTEADPAAPGRRPVALTPRHSGGLVAMWERHGEFRVGLEAYYTGTQALEDNPYRERGSAYVELGMLGEITLGKISLFLNLENLLDVQLNREHPLVRPTRAADGRWAVDAWAPTDGFVVNGGLRIRY